ncbi:MAG: fibronectin type III domain-containing protein [Acidobacteria bacterium]|nr:fibronectin type III domain-containing protein [Acidobacteriota bacterium]
MGKVQGGSDVADIDIGGATSLAVSLTVVPGGTYDVRVAAVSACGAGAPSNEVALTVL